MERLQIIKFVDLYQWNTEIVIQGWTKRFVRTLIETKVCNMKIIKYVDLHFWNKKFITLENTTTNFKYPNFYVYKNKKWCRNPKSIVEMQRRSSPHIHCFIYSIDNR